MKHWMIRIASLTIAGLGGLLIAAPADKSSMIDDKQLLSMAKSANTAEAHLTVAKAYDSKAEALEAKARKHEAKADELANRTSYNPMAAKWPAIVQGPIDRERQLAMQARRAAFEARDLAARHRDLRDKATAADAE